MKIYCPSCGKGVEVGNTKPNFCMSCGGAISPQASLKQKTKPKEEAKQEEIVEDIEDADDEESNAESVDRVPDINKLEVDLLSIPRKQKISDLMGTLSKNIDDGFIQSDARQINKESFWENFKKEAGQSRPK